MPTLLSLESLETDRQFVERQRDEAKQGAWGTSRLMWENRLRELNLRIAELKAGSNSYASVALIFDGLPVIGQGDIRLDFSTDALNSYQKMISIALASQAGEDLPERGPVKGSGKGRLFIRDLVRGSMGFMLEELAPDQQEMIATPLKQAVESATALIGSMTADQTDENFDALLADTQPRMVAAVQKFTKVLQEAGASTRIVGDEHAVGLTGPQVDALYKRLKTVEVKEDVEEVDGTLLGILPDAHQFEMRLPGDDGGTLKGSVADDLALKYLADLQFKETLLLKPVRASINYIRTMRNGKVIKEHKVLQNLVPLG
ncbi:hypothetical protein X753_21285 [Mesorhizobium sp. LNJC399B00]|uniref:hypothetical protein n=1 Tax=unclassified Mesorhizobium TaxID=325217 RepID=UPI0003CE9BF4|nr:MULTISPECIES: hypothetical protein [unclassified Mesorhizobium]ESY03577.1 hypothetical protein X753_21285 [Mesorhizobium sp. LNJC399B00]WJI68861.1 hypothetical protein NLY36_29490 [Mesorhizobium sp. C399B]